VVAGAHPVVIGGSVVGLVVGVSGGVVELAGLGVLAGGLGVEGGGGLTVKSLQQGAQGTAVLVIRNSCHTVSPAAPAVHCNMAQPLLLLLCARARPSCKLMTSSTLLCARGQESLRRRENDANLGRPGPALSALLR
jgi:hypothetical protein